MIERFLDWADRSALKSYDWWDIWGTGFGRWAKTAYVRKSPLGYGGVALLTGADLVAPGFRKLFVEERTFPICHAHMGLGYLNLWHATRETVWLDKAEAIVEPLLAMASPLAKGLGWGMKHEWTTIQGVIPSDTPCNTQTAYPYEFFQGLHAATGKAAYLEYLDRIARHVAGDFPEWRTGNRLACAYSTIDSARVVNANSYRMMMLVDAGVRTGDPVYMEKGLATLRYVLSMQRTNGAWPYSEHQDFVDTYHTCFVLKNLMKTARSLQSARWTGGESAFREEGENGLRQIEEAVGHGFGYFFSRHFDASGFPIPFSVAPRLTLHKYDSYDLAETIGLLAPREEERARVEQLVRFAEGRFQTPEGWFLFRIYPGVSPKGIPYMRYANSAMFLALSTVKRVLATTSAPHAANH